MKPWLVFAGLALLLGACGTSPEDTEPAAPPPAVRPAPPASTPPPPPDSCGASRLQHLVGRPKSEIPIPVDPGRQRVACTTCPVTQDFSPQRLNFFFDADTGVIREIRCG
ncbi:peptidase inhibitor I78 [Phenylobacterium sp.]|jgi:hypothetical protein|uniref:peptidase inhibitor I78 n=1 Tax=Phenylobacterium sp. TaxID=1871053 RepID=UPI002F929315